jgi:hypothetical protein
VSVNVHGPCTGNEASGTAPDGADGTLVDGGVAGGAVVGGLVVGAVAESGRQILMPGYSGVVAVAPFAWYNADVVTPVFEAILIQ